MDKVSPGSFFLDYSCLMIWINFLVFPKAPVIHSKREQNKNILFLNEDMECSSFEQKDINQMFRESII